MEGVYGILNDPIIKDENKGEFSLDDLSRVLDGTNYPIHRHGFLLGLMEKFLICYPKRFREIQLFCS